MPDLTPLSQLLTVAFIIMGTAGAVRFVDWLAR
ncbi:MAG: hypothetical protein K0Q52_1899 [Microbacterium sp.]|jgi:hypothetical protein|nr:hypothetical protein [Microbacterium sp.]